MQVHLEVADDEQLRKAVRDLIKGQVTSIIQSEGLDALITRVLETKIKDEAVNKKALETVDFLVRNKITKDTTFFLEPRIYIKDIIRELVRDCVSRLITEDLVRDLVKQSVVEYTKGFLGISK